MGNNAPVSVQDNVVGEAEKANLYAFNPSTQQFEQVEVGPNGALQVSVPTGSELATDLQEVAGQQQSAVDIAAVLDGLTYDGDGLLVDSDGPLDVSAAEVDVDIATQSLSPLTITDDGNFAITTWNAGTLPVEQQSPVAIENTSNAQVDPATEGSLTSQQPREVSDRGASEYTLASSADISGGVSQTLSNVDSFSIFLDVGGSVDITVEFSPDGGATWYEPAGESPVSFASAGQDIVLTEYDANAVQLTGSNTTAVTAQVREVV